MSCADVKCSSKNVSPTLRARCCGVNRGGITPATPKKKSQGQKDIEEFVSGKNPPKDKRNTSEDTRNVLEKVFQEGIGAGGKPGDEQGKGGGGTGDSDKCSGCDAGNIGCEIGKLSCEFTSAMGDQLPFIAVMTGALIIFIISMR
jgi:hypothetical protein